MLAGSVGQIRLATDVELCMRFIHGRRDFPPDFLQNAIVYGTALYEAALERWPDDALLMVPPSTLQAGHGKAACVPGGLDSGG